MLGADSPQLYSCSYIPSAVGWCLSLLACLQTWDQSCPSWSASPHTPESPQPLWNTPVGSVTLCMSETQHWGDEGWGDSRGSQDSAGNTVTQGVSGHCTHIPLLGREAIELLCEKAVTALHTDSSAGSVSHFLCFGPQCEQRALSKLTWRLSKATLSRLGSSGVNFIGIRSFIFMGRPDMGHNTALLWQGGNASLHHRYFYTGNT